ncbi:porin family protein [Litoribrevibacter euphylliae]|uniref:Porin family protein n=1 Tax=Litoribrevibacter euphylliae TaxID=1834034 RepID=A0ABV7HLL7_9GAMM
MITTRTLACLSLVSILPFASVVHAEMGPYVGIGAGITKFYDDGFIEDNQGNGDWDDSGTAYGFVAGYKFSNNFSIEWSYQDYDYNEYGVDSLSDVDMQAWHISGLMALPFEETFLGKLDLYGKLGFGESDFSYRQAQFGVGEDQTSESFILGGGSQFYINQNFRIRTELDITTFNLEASTSQNATSYLTKDYTFTALTAKAMLVYAF